MSKLNKSNHLDLSRSSRFSLVLNPSEYVEPFDEHDDTHDHSEHEKQLDVVFAKLEEKKAEFEELKKKSLDELEEMIENGIL